MRSSLTFGAALLGAGLGCFVLASCGSDPQANAVSQSPAAEAAGKTAAAGTARPARMRADGFRYGVKRRAPERSAKSAETLHVASANFQQVCGGTPDLKYYGGPIVQTPIVVPVYWNGNVNAGVTGNLPQFFKDMLASSYWTMLQEYDTVGLTNPAGTNQAILSNGTVTAGVTISPVHCPTTTSTTTCKLTDAEIQTELDAQIKAGNLPAPQLDCTGNVETIYMVNFPPHVQVTGPDGAGTSCVNSNQSFCAYHNTGTYGASTPLVYGVLMDEYTGGCATGCGNGNSLENTTSTASHELAEAATDTDIGLLPTTATQNEAPMAWYDGSNLNCGEVADICDDGTTDTIAKTGGGTWAVQELWSEARKTCTSASQNLTLCSGTTTTSCRKCSCGDTGYDCGTGTPACETTSTNVLFGACEQCTSKNACANNSTCEQSTTPAQDDICASACVPITACPAGDNCGTISNGCGGTVTCGGTCAAGETCTSNVCTSTCVPITACPAGENCGTISNGCGGTLSCGTCPTNDTCTNNVCSSTCIPLSTCPAGDNCGTLSNGCGGLLLCGASCPANQTCGGGGTPNVCGTGSCVPITTCPAGDNCGTISDGCSGMVTCGGACPAGESCTNNVCTSTCVPMTTCPAGSNCGTLSNGCGGTLVCGGACPAGETCGGGGTPNVCACQPLAQCPAGLDCGNYGDGCGGIISCGTCAANQTCDFSTNTCLGGTTSSSSSSSASSASSASSSAGATSSSSSSSGSVSATSSSGAATSSSSSGTGGAGGSSTASSTSSGTTTNGSTSSGSTGSTSSGAGGAATTSSGSTGSTSSGATSTGSTSSGAGGTATTSSGSTGSFGFGGSGSGGAGGSGEASTGNGTGNASGVTGLPTQNGGCSCKTTGDTDDGTSAPLAAFGVVAFVGAMRSRRRRRAA